VLIPRNRVRKPVLEGFELAPGVSSAAMALLIIFVGLTVLTAAAIGGAVAAGTTTAVVVALVIHLVGSTIVIGATLAALGPDGSD
jgi:hypothetical protein